ncbi:Uncharacterized protein HZ326_25458 [Fusarium oxysporum f. sp. albedinis]|nr:Uncharacterized protein HZ326_25458 [Fusarium oxysporum f. sp. albedinis]
MPRPCLQTIDTKFPLSVAQNSRRCSEPRPIPNDTPHETTSSDCSGLCYPVNTVDYQVAMVAVLNLITILTSCHGSSRTPSDD